MLFLIFAVSVAALIVAIKVLRDSRPLPGQPTPAERIAGLEERVRDLLYRVWTLEQQRGDVPLQPEAPPVPAPTDLAPSAHEPLPSPAWNATPEAVQAAASTCAGAASRPRAADRRALDHVDRRDRHPLRRLLLREVVDREQPDRSARASRSRLGGGRRPAPRGTRAQPSPRRAVPVGRTGGPAPRPLLPLALRRPRLLQPPPGRRRLRPDVHRDRAGHRGRRRLRAPGHRGPRAARWPAHAGAAGAAGAARARPDGLPLHSRHPRAGHRALPHLARAESLRMGRHRAAPVANSPA